MKKIYYYTVNQIIDGEEINPKTQVYSSKEKFLKDLKIVVREDNKFAVANGWVYDKNNRNSIDIDYDVIDNELKSAETVYCLYKDGESSENCVTVCYGVNVSGKGDYFDKFFKKLDEDDCSEFEIYSPTDLMDYMCSILEGNIQYDLGIDFDREDTIKFAEALLERIKEDKE